MNASRQVRPAETASVVLSSNPAGVSIARFDGRGAHVPETLARCVSFCPVRFNAALVEYRA
jgi:hypothetical protein